MAPTPFATVLIVFPILLSVFLFQPWSLPLSVAGAQCVALRLTVWNRVSFPASTLYETSRQTYWSQQQQNMTPTCIVKPQSTSDVSSAIWTISTFTRLTALVGLNPCPVAIKGGGHTPWEGSSSADGGVTIDMGAMNEVSVNDDKSVAHVGPGAKWADVYETLDPLQVAVVGGRVASVGVAGLLLGGGMSFFSPRFGWACDNVENYEVVLASGQLTNANARENPDLWSALKGGSNNFGVVTRFDLRTFPQGDIWGGQIINPIETRQEAHKAFTTLNSMSEYDEFATVINNIIYTSTSKSWVIFNILVYTKPEAHPKALEAFTQIEPVYHSTMGTTNISSLTKDIDQQSTRGLRYLFITATYGNDADLLSTIFENANSTLQSIESVPGLMYVLTFQPVPSSITSKVASDAPHAMGLDHQDGPQVLTLVNLHWNDAEDDDKVYAAAESWLKQSDEEASKRGLKRPWIYLNYAHSSQRPIDGYGSANKKKLQDVSRKYDPNGLFQKSVIGGFKVFS